MTEKHDISPNVLKVIIAKAWSDAGFKAKLLANATETLSSMGVKVPPGITIKVVEDTDSAWHLVIPPQSADGSLTDDQLGKVAGGFAQHVMGGMLFSSDKPK